MFLTFHGIIVLNTDFKYSEWLLLASSVFASFVPIHIFGNPVHSESYLYNQNQSTTLTYQRDLILESTIEEIYESAVSASLKLLQSQKNYVSLIRHQLVTIYGETRTEMKNALKLLDFVKDSLDHNEETVHKLLEINELTTDVLRTRLPMEKFLFEKLSDTWKEIISFLKKQDTAKVTMDSTLLQTWLDIAIHEFFELNSDIERLLNVEYTRRFIETCVENYETAANYYVNNILPIGCSKTCWRNTAFATRTQDHHNDSNNTQKYYDDSSGLIESDPYGLLSSYEDNPQGVTPDLYYEDALLEALEILDEHETFIKMVKKQLDQTFGENNEHFLKLRESLQSAEHLINQKTEILREKFASVFTEKDMTQILIEKSTFETLLSTWKEVKHAIDKLKSKKVKGFEDLVKWLKTVDQKSRRKYDVIETFADEIKVMIRDNNRKTTQH